MDPSSLRNHPRVQAAYNHVIASDERTVRDQIALTEIPSPPFGEEARGARMAELFAEVGLSNVHTDEVGNVLGLRAGDATADPLVLTAHLDTVFPTGTDVTVTVEEGVVRAPGISDDGRGLAALVALARVLGAADVPNDRPILFVATVGEEGLGDLRGVKHLFRDGGPGAGAAAFVSLDGAGLRTLVHRGLGAVRLRVVVRGRGGHSWVDRGMPNPIHALGRAIGALASWPPPTQPTLSLAVSRFGGGTSVNTIPGEAWAELDLRSESMHHLAVAEDRVRAVLKRSIDEENASGAEPTDPVDFEIVRIGSRPAGVTPVDSFLVQAAITATRMLDCDVDLVTSSTDANLPMSLGIPAITLGAGGEAGGVHTVDEWYRNTEGPEGICRALYTALLVTGLA